MSFVAGLRKSQLPQKFAELIKPMASVLEKTDVELARVEIGIQRIVDDEPQVRLLMTIPTSASSLPPFSSRSSTMLAAFAMHTRSAHISAWCHPRRARATDVDSEP